MPTGCQEQWIERAQALGRAQARSLWLLLVATIFFLAVGSGVSVSPDDPTVRVPLLGVEARALVVWASGPFVLSFLVSVMMGALRARDIAIKKAGGDTETAGANEQWDLNPNPLDLAKYARKETPLLLRRLSLLGYPAFLTLVMIEVGWLAAGLTGSYSTLPSAAKWLLWASTPFVLIALWQVLWYWFKTVGKAFDPNFWPDYEPDPNGDEG